MSQVECDNSQESGVTARYGSYVPQHAQKNITAIQWLTQGYY
jgi:hypothetical protein